LGNPFGDVFTLNREQLEAFFPVLKSRTERFDFFFLSIMWGKTEKRPFNMDAQNIRPTRPLLYVYIVFIIYF